MSAVELAVAEWVPVARALGFPPLDRLPPAERARLFTTLGELYVTDAEVAALARYAAARRIAAAHGRHLPPPEPRR